MRVPRGIREVVLGIVALLSVGATWAHAAPQTQPRCKNFGLVTTCQFQPSQLNLSPNASSATMLKVTVSAKPAALVVQPPAGRSNELPSFRLIIILLTMAHTDG